MSVVLRVWQELDLADIEKYLFVIGELSGECFRCHKVGISLKDKSCPGCRATFRYIAFRRRIDANSIHRFKNEFPDATLIEFDDFKKVIQKNKAKKFLDI